MWSRQREARRRVAAQVKAKLVWKCSWSPGWHPPKMGWSRAMVSYCAYKKQRSTPPPVRTASNVSTDARAALCDYQWVHTEWPRVPQCSSDVACPQDDSWSISCIGLCVQWSPCFVLVGLCSLHTFGLLRVYRNSVHLFTIWNEFYYTASICCLIVIAIAFK